MVELHASWKSNAHANAQRDRPASTATATLTTGVGRPTPAMGVRPRVLAVLAVVVLAQQAAASQCPAKVPAAPHTRGCETIRQPQHIGITCTAKCAAPFVGESVVWRCMSINNGTWQTDRQQVGTQCSEPPIAGIPTQSACQTLCPGCETNPNPNKLDPDGNGHQPASCTDCSSVEHKCWEKSDRACDCFMSLGFCKVGEKPEKVEGQECPSCWPYENTACACTAALQFCAAAPEPEPEMVTFGLSVGMTFVAILAEFFYALTSFGPAITFNIGWQMLFAAGLSDGSLTSVTVNLAVMELFSASVQLTWLWQQFDARFALANVAPTLIFTIIGTYLLVLLDSVWLKRALAALLVTLALDRVRKRCRADAAALIPLHQPKEVAAAADDPKVLKSKLPYEERDIWSKSGLDLKDQSDLFGVVLCGVGVGLIGGIFGVGQYEIHFAFKIHYFGSILD